jgi:hypothetical protein
LGRGEVVVMIRGGPTVKVTGMVKDGWLASELGVTTLIWAVVVLVGNGGCAFSINGSALSDEPVRPRKVGSSEAVVTLSQAGAGLGSSYP